MMQSLTWSKNDARHEATFWCAMLTISVLLVSYCGQKQTYIKRNNGRCLSKKFKNQTFVIASQENYEWYNYRHGRIQDLWGLKLTLFLGPYLRIENYEHKIRYETEYLFRRRKEITSNYKFKNAGKCPKHNKIQKNSIYFYQLTAWHSSIILSFLHVLAAYSLVASSYDNDFVISFSIQRIER
jgi:hypothetical protein